MATTDKISVQTPATELGATHILLADLMTAVLAAIARAEDTTTLMNGKDMALEGLLRLIEELKTDRKKYEEDKEKQDRIKSIDKAIELHKASAVVILAEYEKEIADIKSEFFQNIYKDRLKELRKKFAAK